MLIKIIKIVHRSCGPHYNTSTGLIALIKRGIRKKVVFRNIMCIFFFQILDIRLYIKFWGEKEQLERENDEGERESYEKNRHWRFM